MSRTRLALLLGGAIVIHLAMLYLPSAPDTGGFSFPPGTDKLVHVVLFAAPAFLMRRLTPKWWPIWLLAAHAPLSELIQWRLLDQRSGDPFDMMADLAGVALGCWLASLWASRAATRG